VKNARKRRLVEEANEPRKKGEEQSDKQVGRKGNRGGDGFSFGEERGELREFLASCSSSAAISD
jgi:hypothetical protein